MPKLRSSSSLEDDSKKIDYRRRNFACVVYPDSAPQNWLEIISNFKIPFLISPLHDKDLNPTGEPKKPHFHVLAMFEGKKSCEQVAKLFKTFGGVGCEAVESLRGYARYLCHLDNPEKAQYLPENVKCFGGVDYGDCIGLPTDKYKCIREMIDFINENHIFSYAKLLEYAAENHYDWFRVLCDNGTIVVKEYLKSRTWQLENRALSPKIDTETGEYLHD